MPFRRKIPTPSPPPVSYLEAEDAVSEAGVSPPEQPVGNEYEIGYGRPPKHTQFRKGESGNPKGRKKSSKGLNTIVREAMLQKVSVRTAQGEKRMTRAEATFAKMMEKAFSGDPRALALVLNMYREAVPDEIGHASDTADRASASDEKMIEDFFKQFRSPQADNAAKEVGAHE
jgi:Family of unknown function (DUF5681)